MDFQFTSTVSSYFEGPRSARISRACLAITNVVSLRRAGVPDRARDDPASASARRSLVLPATTFVALGCVPGRCRRSGSAACSTPPTTASATRSTSRPRRRSTPTTPARSTRRRRSSTCSCSASRRRSASARASRMSQLVPRLRERPLALARVDRGHRRCGRSPRAMRVGCFDEKTAPGGASEPDEQRGARRACQRQHVPAHARRRTAVEASARTRRGRRRPFHGVREDHAPRRPRCRRRRTIQPSDSSKPSATMRPPATLIADVRGVALPRTSATRDSLRRSPAAASRRPSSRSRHAPDASSGTPRIGSAPHARRRRIERQPDRSERGLPGADGVVGALAADRLPWRPARSRRRCRCRRTPSSPSTTSRRRCAASRVDPRGSGDVPPYRDRRSCRPAARLRTGARRRSTQPRDDGEHAA